MRLKLGDLRPEDDAFFSTFSRDCTREEASEAGIFVEAATFDNDVEDLVVRELGEEAFLWSTVSSPLDVGLADREELRAGTEGERSLPSGFLSGCASSNSTTIVSITSFGRLSSTGFVSATDSFSCSGVSTGWDCSITTSSFTDACDTWASSSFVRLCFEDLNLLKRESSTVDLDLPTLFIEDLLPVLAFLDAIGAS